MSSPIKTYPTKSTGVGDHAQVTGTDVAGDKRALDVAVVGGSIGISGDVGAIPRGATGPYFVTETTVGVVSAAFPAVSLVNRVSLSIRNLSAISIYIVNGVGLTVADPKWEIGPNETHNWDVDAANSVYIVSTAPAAISILEVAST